MNRRRDAETISPRTPAIWHDFGKNVQSTLCAKVRAERLHCLPHNVSDLRQNECSHPPPTRTLYGSRSHVLERELTSLQPIPSQPTLQKRITRIPRFIQNRVNPVASDIELFRPSFGAWSSSTSGGPHTM